MSDQNFRRFNKYSCKDPAETFVWVFQLLYSRCFVQVKAPRVYRGHACRFCCTGSAHKRILCTNSMHKRSKCKLNMFHNFGGSSSSPESYWSGGGNSANAMLFETFRNMFSPAHLNNKMIEGIVEKRVPFLGVLFFILRMRHNFFKVHLHFFSKGRVALRG